MIALALVTVDFFLDVTDEICEDLTGYKFENVLWLVDDFGGGEFTPALGPEEHRSILGRWFLVKQSDGSPST